MRTAFVLLAALTGASPGLAEPGMVSLATDAAAGPRSLAVSVWYPAHDAASVEIGGNAVFEGAAAIPGGRVAAGPFPLVLVSHGGLRSAADSGAWLSAALAESGYIAVEVNAPRIDEAKQAVDEIWRRPEDLGRALTLLLDHADWSGRIDTDRVFAVGFALGGTAALALAGRDLDVEGYMRSCDDDDDGGGDGRGAQPGPDCGWFAAGGASPAMVDRERLAASRRDPRVAAVVAISPEYLDKLSPAPAGVPTAVVSLGGSGAEDPGEAAGITIADATPFDAFPVCTEAGPRILSEEGADPALCGETRARERIHAEIVAKITSFLAAEAPE